MSPSPAPKMNRDPGPGDAADKTAVRDDLAALFLRGIERNAAVQKQCLDVAVQHNKETFEGWKKIAEKTPGVPQLPLLNAAIAALNRYADVHKSAIDLVVEQTRVWTEAFKDRTNSASKSAESAVNMAKEAMESSFAVQKKAFEQTAAQTKAVVDATRQQFGFKGPQADAMTDTFQRGMDTIIEAQKELLEIVTH